MLYCAVCLALYPDGGPWRLAETTIDGTALCIPHIPPFTHPGASMWSALNEERAHAALQAPPEA